MLKGSRIVRRKIRNHKENLSYSLIPVTSFVVRKERHMITYTVYNMLNISENSRYVFWLLSLSKNRGENDSGVMCYG